MVWVERTMQYDQQIKIRFGSKVYTTNWGEFGKLIKRTVKRVLPPDFRIAGVASSKSSESQYYWVLTGNRCFSFRISNHRPLKGLPTTQQVNFITRYYQDFGELESALTA